MPVLSSWSLAEDVKPVVVHGGCVTEAGSVHMVMARALLSLINRLSDAIDAGSTALLNKASSSLFQI